MSRLLNRKDKLASRTVFWPLDLLKEDFPDCRIWTYGYGHDLSDESADPTLALLDNLRSFQFRRDLIFITHDLGGLLVKRALLYAWISKHSVDQDIKRHTKGVVFFGTPHRFLDDSTFYAIFQKLSVTTRVVFDPPDWNVNAVNTCNNKFSKLVANHGLQILNILEGDGSQIGRTSNAFNLV